MCFFVDVGLRWDSLGDLPIFFILRHAVLIFAVVYFKTFPTG
jgi:hypothetical protein